MISFGGTPQETRVSFSRKRLERAKVLWEKKLMPSDTYDQLVSELVLAENELARGLLEHRITQLEHERSKLVLEGLTIRSPVSGIVSERSLSAGEFIHEAGHVVTVAALDPLHVEVFLPVTMFPRVKVGMTGVVEPAEPVSGRYAATVMVVDRVFDAASGSFGVRLSLPNGDGVLPAGHRCMVTFGLEQMPLVGRAM